MLSERKISKIVYNMILKTAKHLLVTGVSTFKGCSLGKGDSCLEEAKQLRHTYSAKSLWQSLRKFIFPQNVFKLVLPHTMKVKNESQSHSVVSDSATPWTIESMEFSRPEYWSGQPFSSPGCLPNPGTKARSPALEADSLPAEPQGKPKNTGVGSFNFQLFL